MLQDTRGIVLRSVKYGETSLVSSIFTETYGVQSYLVQGVRSARAKGQKAGLLQPSTILDMVVYHQPQKNLQRIREFQPAYIYQSMQEEIVKNSIALFSIELLLRLLPEEAPQPELFQFSYDYLIALDKMKNSEVANFPLWFMIESSRILGYPVQGEYSTDTPHLNLREGGFTQQPPVIEPYVNDEDAKALSQLLEATDFAALKDTDMNAAMRYRLLDWYVAFFHQHAQHLSNIKSLAVLRSILH